MSNKIKVEMEFPIHASPSMIFQYLTTPSGLSGWFADDVNSRGQIFTFIWDGEEEKAKIASKKDNERVKYKWLDEDDKETGTYFEFKIVVDELTKDVSLLVTDFCDEDEEEEIRMLWENQIGELKHIIGAT
jgi:uncharacterized protein YndB with AHSA1/START domain